MEKFILFREYHDGDIMKTYCDTRKEAVEFTKAFQCDDITMVDEYGIFEVMKMNGEVIAHV